MVLGKMSNDFQVPSNNGRIWESPLYHHVLIHHMDFPHLHHFFPHNVLLTCQLASDNHQQTMTLKVVMRINGLNIVTEVFTTCK